MQSENMTRIHYQFTVIVLLLCTFGFSIHLIEQRSMWYDEWFSWHYSSRAFLDTLETAEDVHPPAYYMFLWFWNQWTGSDQLFVMRYSSVLVGVFALAFASHWVLHAFNRHISLIMVAFVGTSGVYLHYLHELRMYSMVVLLTVLSWWWFERVLRKKRWAWVGYGIVLACMAYTYYFTAFMVLPQLVWALIHERKSLSRLLWGYGLALCLFAPWLPIFWQQVQFDSQYASYGIALPIVGLIGKGAATKPTDWQSFHAFIEQYSAGQLSFVLILSGLGIINGWRFYRQQRAYWSILGWSLGVTALFFAVNLVMPVYHPRYLLMILPSLGVLMGLGLEPIARLTSPVLLTLMVIQGVLTAPHGFDEPHPPHDVMLGAIAKNFEEGDVIWYNMDSGARGSSLFGAPSYYLERVYPQITSDDFVWAAPSEFVGEHANRRVWDVRDVYTIPPTDASEGLESGRTLTEMTSFAPFIVRLYEPIPTTLPIQFGEVFGVRYRVEDKVVKLWFEVLQQPDRDYSYGLHVWDAQGNVIQQWDGILKETDFENPTQEQVSSQWTLQSAGYFMSIPYALPSALPSGEYSLNLTLYDWEVAPSGLPIMQEHAKSLGRNFIRLAEFIR